MQGCAFWGLKELSGAPYDQELPHQEQARAWLSSRGATVGAKMSGAAAPSASGALPDGPGGGGSCTPGAPSPERELCGEPSVIALSSTGM